MLKFKDLSDLNACLASFCCHVIFMIVLGLLHSAIPVRPTPNSMTVELGSGPGNLGGDAGALPGDVELGQSLSDAAESLAQNIFENDKTLTSRLDPETALPTSRVELTLDSKMLPDLSRNSRRPSDLADGSGLAARLGFGGRGTGRQGNGDGGGGDPFGQKGAFFGIPSRGKTVVYIIDSSGSMSNQKKFILATRELIYSLSHLQIYQKYFVILYSDDAHPMDADEPVLATSNQVEQTKDWLSQIKPEGGTKPYPAFLYAFKLQPDEIFFLSDGMFNADLVQKLELADSGNRIPIHTIAFKNAQSEGLMKMISRRSGGTYRFVK